MDINEKKTFKLKNKIIIKKQRTLGMQITLALFLLSSQASQEEANRDLRYNCQLVEPSLFPLLLDFNLHAI